MVAVDQSIASGFDSTDAPLFAESRTDDILREIQETGYSILQAPIFDQDGSTLLQIANSLGVPDGHDAAGTVLWDVRPKSSSLSVARSHTLSEFPLHTDAAFEPNPPRFVGLQVLKADRFGGGVTLLRDLQPLLSNLSAVAFRSLRLESVLWTVPEEFLIDEKVTKAPVIGSSGAIRYRRDIIIEDALSATQRSALAELDELVAGHEHCQKFLLKDGAVIIIDNWRMVHGRTEIIDPLRHLKRVRFSATCSDVF